MKKVFRAPIRTFIAGLLAVLPVVVTVAVIVWVVSLIDQFVGPHSAVGNLLVSIGLTVVETQIAAYVIGIGVVSDSEKELHKRARIGHPLHR
jgi:uncharacterized membrane protein